MLRLAEKETRLGSKKAIQCWRKAWPHAGTPAVELGANASGFVGFKVERVPADDCYFCAVKIHGTCEGFGGQGHWGVFGGDYLKHRSFIRATVEMSRGSRPERKKACRADETAREGVEVLAPCGHICVAVTFPQQHSAPPLREGQ